MEEKSPRCPTSPPVRPAADKGRCRQGRFRVARTASVSRTTISHALNGLGKVDLRTREWVKRLAAELGHPLGLRAQRLRRGRPGRSRSRRRFRSPVRAVRPCSASPRMWPRRSPSGHSCTVSRWCWPLR
ncbi:LacI family DNA-binding transcriptional regulator [Streptomyces sp. Y7]|uniref:LacI family DNA-binding transcriptional regulator n=1 Tax=Streptomyces sp. Y7 TaxID=3342392 RepID=UPI00371C47DF